MNNLTKLNHIHTYIHTYMEKRKREENTTNTNIIFYDKKDLATLQLIAFHNNTNVSSIISNLTREFNLLFEEKNPQRNLFNFEERPKIHFDTDEREAYLYLMSLSQKEYKEWANKLQMWLNLERKVTNRR